MKITNYIRNKKYKLINNLIMNKIKNQTNKRINKIDLILFFII